MDSVVVLVLAALCAAPSAAFLQDILQPIQELKQSLLPHPQQPYPQYYHQYRRAAYDGPAQQQGYVSSRPVVYQYVQSRPVQSVQPAVQQHYDVGTGYSYGGASSNPFAAFWQQGVQGVQGLASNAWLPWSANRQPFQQAAAQPLSATMVPAQPVQLQQQQQPLQAIWSILPWTASHSAQQQPASGNPVLSFFQNSASLLPWSQQSRPGLIYTTPLAPSFSSSSSSSLSSGPSAHVVSASIAAPVQQSLQAASLSPEQAAVVHESSGTPDVKPEGLVLDDSTLAVQHLADNGIRRIALSHQHEAGVPCAT